MTNPPVRFIVNSGVFFGATDSSVNAARRSIFHNRRSSHFNSGSLSFARLKNAMIMMISNQMLVCKMAPCRPLHFSFTSGPFMDDPPLTLVCVGSMSTRPASVAALAAHDATIL